MHVERWIWCVRFFYFFSNYAFYSLSKYWVIVKSVLRCGARYSKFNNNPSPERILFYFVEKERSIEKRALEKQKNLVRPATHVLNHFLSLSRCLSAIRKSGTPDQIINRSHTHFSSYRSNNCPLPSSCFCRFSSFQSILYWWLWRLKRYAAHYRIRK